MGEAAGTSMAAWREPKGCVAVVGLGRIGLPLAIQYAWRSYRVIGCDSDPRVVEGVNVGRAHIQEEPELEVWLGRALERCLLGATQDTTEAVRQADVVVVIVPAQINERQEADLQALEAATRAIGAGLRPGQLVIYETTVPVGTTRLRLAPLLEQVSRLSAGSDFLLAYSPERASVGRIFHDLASYPKVVGGINEASLAAAAAFYESALDAPVLSMANTDDAELLKLVEMSYREMNRALAHEYARYAAGRLEAEIGPLAGRSVLLLGVPSRGEVRATPFSSTRLFQEALLARGAAVYVDDPFFSAGELEASGYAPLLLEQRGEISAVIVQADYLSYQSFDFSLFPHCQVVLDGRQAIQQSAVESRGMRYLSIGDERGTLAQSG